MKSYLLIVNAANGILNDMIANTELVYKYFGSCYVEKGALIIGYVGSPINQVRMLLEETTDSKNNELYFKKVVEISEGLSISNDESLINFIDQAEANSSDLIEIDNDTLSKIKSALFSKISLQLDMDSSRDLNESHDKVLKYVTGLQSDFKRNRILFGAPGTGKSFEVNSDKNKLLKDCSELDYERVTFHPDYTYANFVGTYKPTMVKKNSVDSEKQHIVDVLKDTNKTAQEKYDLLYNEFNGDGLTRLPILIGLYDDGSFTTKKVDGTDAAGNNSVERNHGRAIRPYVSLANNECEEISYEYVPGPFMRVLVKALRSAMSSNPKPFLLIIEEINRANVSAVFGDVFQLLDRNSDNVSEYFISTTNDMRKYLSKELNVAESEVETIKIPDNMFIWATMNSADQGVLPMDTAFKRRWDFKYLGIDDAVSSYSQKIKSNEFTLGLKGHARKVRWDELRTAINDVLSSETYNINEDKLLGPYFISKSALENSDNSAFIETFKNKVIMYLFEDAVRQKRNTFFDSCKEESKGIRYSDICKKFDELGVGIFPIEISRRFITKPENDDV